MIPRSLPPIAVLLQKEEPTSQEADFLILSVLDFGSLGAGSQLLEWIFGTATTAEEKGQKCERASHLSWGLAYDDDACLEFGGVSGEFGLSNFSVCSSQSSKLFIPGAKTPRSLQAPNETENATPRLRSPD